MDLFAQGPGGAMNDKTFRWIKSEFCRVGHDPPDVSYAVYEHTVRRGLWIHQKTRRPYA